MQAAYAFSLVIEFSGKTMYGIDQLRRLSLMYDEPKIGMAKRHIEREKAWSDILALQKCQR